MSEALPLILTGLAFWMLIALLAGLLLGRMVQIRESRTTDESDRPDLTDQADEPGRDPHRSGGTADAPEPGRPRGVAPSADGRSPGR